jgi:tape measure domain-containing protein
LGKIRIDFESNNAKTSLRSLISFNDELARSIGLTSRLEKASKTSRFNASFEKAERSAAELRAEVSKLESATNQARRRVDGLGDSFGEAARNGGLLQGAIQGLAAGAAFGVIDALSNAVGELGNRVGEFIASTLQVGGAAQQADVAFSTILGSAEEAQIVLGQLSDFAATTPFDLPGIRSAGQQLLAFGFQQDSLIENLERVGNVAAGVNTPFNELAVIYGKARVQGRLFAEDINQLTERGIPIIGELADQFGVTESQVRELVSAGDVGFAELEQAFINMTSAGGQFAGLMDAQSQTIPGQISNIQDSFTQFQETIFNAFSPALAAALETISEVLAGIGERSQGLDSISAAGERLGEALSGNPEIIEQLSSALAGVADEIVDQIAGIIDSFADLLSNDAAIQNLSDDIEDFGSAITTLGAAVQFVIDLTSGLATLRQEGGEIPILGRQIEGAFSPLGPVLGVVAASLNQIGRLIGTVAGGARDLAGALIGLDAAAAQGANTALGNTANTIEQSLNSIRQQARALGEQIGEGVNETANLEQPLELSAEEAQAQAAEELEKRLDEANQVAKKANLERLNQNLQLERQLRASGASEAEIKERTAQAGLEAEQAALEGELDIQRQRVNAYEEGTKERADAEIALAQIQNDLLQNQIDQELAAREAEIRAIEEVIAAESRAANESIASNQARLDSIARVEASIQRQNDLLNQQANLQQAITDLRGAVADREIAQAENALAITQEIANIESKLNGDSELSAEQRLALTEERAALEARLGDLGFERGANEQQILQQIIALQAQRFEQERAALEQNQAIERLSLEVEIERQRLAAARAVSEEQIALRRLELQRAELEGAIRIAEARGDTQAAADARSQLSILDEQIAGQQELLSLTQEAQAAEAQSAEIQRGTLAAQQQQAQLALAQQQQSTAQGLADQGAGIGGAAATESANLLNQTTLRADEEARVGEELANALQEQVNLQSEGDRLLSQTTALADEAERYAAAIGGASPSGGGSVPGIPEFRAGGIIPAGQVAKVHRDEYIRPAAALAVTSQKSSRAIDREMRQLMLQGQHQALGRLRPMPVAMGDTKAIEKGLKELLHAVQTRPPANLNMPYQNIGQTEEQIRAMQRRQSIDMVRALGRL